MTSTTKSSRKVGTYPFSQIYPKRPTMSPADPQQAFGINPSPPNPWLSVLRPSAGSPLAVASAGRDWPTWGAASSGVSGANNPRHRRIGAMGLTVTAADCVAFLVPRSLTRQPHGEVSHLVLRVQKARYGTPPAVPMDFDIGRYR